MPDLTAVWAFVIGPGGALALAILGLLGLIRGWIVPGFIYTATVGRLDVALASLEANASAMDRLTDEVRAFYRGR